MVCLFLSLYGSISCVPVTDHESSFTGLFQITVKLPHEPHKIQVMVGIISTGVMRLEE